jgi:hypothetical protein
VAARSIATRLMQVRPLRLHFLELGLTLLKSVFPLLKPSLYLFVYGHTSLVGKVTLAERRYRGNTLMS